MIAIASYIYLSVGGIVGAIMFSIGLLTILNMQFKLFTGSVGYIKSKNDIKDNLIILSGNIIGARDFSFSARSSSIFGLY